MEAKLLHRQKLHTPILIVHAKDDENVPFWHGAGLFDAIAQTVDPNLLSTQKIGSGDGKEPFGTLKFLTGRKAVFFELEKGGHMDIVHWEGVIDVIGEVV